MVKRIRDEIEDIDGFITKVKEKEPNVYISNNIMSVIIKIFAGAKAFYPIPADSISIPPALPADRNSMVGGIPVPSNQAWILSDVYVSNVEVDGALMIYSNGIRLLQTIPTITKPKLRPLIFLPQHIVSFSFVPYRNVEKETTQAIIFDVIVIDFNFTQRKPSEIESLLDALI